ncbi:hypothetical protein H257_06946 [Aphanomyces astaci]|uniref:Mediator complex subunit 15 KIX domain-containing protein n=1 Tax=Aphanomyces astaci TaxID=112090 RepID=W4GKY7_APHAT|nr:hypothetical protein H257_06946 [Aphanomyces astaci]ETV79699.1 hypothetical protein H257_06946 [Aphanomyces astaci]RQM19013.1 hypothetical protein B5M09_008560 [Aphanomyces astaci]|eukprot:XP_009830635.1 hypothetical protein H257_06946 [Aphanomyces astaci]
MNAAAPAGWRLEVTEDMRKGKITEMYIELLRLSGENDRQKVWQSAAKFELTLWTQSVDKATYWTKLEKKVAALKKKPQPGTVAPPLPAAPQQVSSAPSIPHQQQHQQAPSIQTQAQYSSQMGANSMQFNQAMLMQQAEMLKKQQEQHQLAALNHARQQQAQAQAQAQAAAQAKAAADKQQLQEQQRLHALNLARQQQQQQLATARAAAAAAAPVSVPTPPMAGHTQVLHQLQQQFQQQKQAVLTTQHNELQRLRQAQLLEQNHLANLHSTQDTPPDLRRLQLTQLQQQHLVAQNKLAHEHKAKTDELMRRHQQILTSKLTPAGGAAVQVPAAHADAAAAAQARARALSRLQATTQQGPPPAAAATTTAIPSSAAPSPDAYGEKLKQVKAKYWNDLEIAQREFTRIAAQKPPAGAAAQQTIQNQERVKVFLQNLKRIMTLLAQDPAKATTNNVDMLIKVEQHIERQVIPALLRVKSDKSKKEEVKVDMTKQPTSTAKTAAEAQRQSTAQQTAVQADAVRQARELQLKKAEQLKAEHIARAQAAAAAAASLKAERKDAESKALAATLQLQNNKDMVLSPNQRAALEEQAARLTVQAKDLIAQQAHVTSPTSRAVIGQTAIMCTQEVARIAEHLAQSKAAQARGATGPKFASIVDTSSTSSATDRLLLAVKTYARDKPEVLTQAAPVFLELSVAIGATVTTSHV